MTRGEEKREKREEGERKRGRVGTINGDVRSILGYAHTPPPPPPYQHTIHAIPQPLPLPSPPTTPSTHTEHLLRPVLSATCDAHVLEILAVVAACFRLVIHIVFEQDL